MEQDISEYSSILNPPKWITVFSNMRNIYFLVSCFRGYDGSSDLHVGITNTTGK